MITFLICLTLLVVAYFTYGSYLSRVIEIDGEAATPATSMADGVDYIRLPMWRTFLIQLLNIAGLGPIFGAVLGAAFGPVAFLWITLGGIFLGSMHDYLAGVISLKRGGESLPESIGLYLGSSARLFMRIFTAILLIMVGAAFISQPAAIVATIIDIPALNGIAVGSTSWMMVIILSVIVLYYLLATILPIDKIIGKLYPIFGALILLMAVALLGVLLLSGDYQIPELTSFDNCITNSESTPIFPMMFIIIACGAISGFHATQSPMMARCLTNEKEAKSVFYGAMITESIVTLIWAAIAMAFWNGVEGLNSAIADNGGQAIILIDIITKTTLGKVFASVVLFGVVACAITSGDTALRSARLIFAEFVGLNQRPLRNRLLITIPIFAVTFIIIFVLPFISMWSYVAWFNQCLAVTTLWTITVYLYQKRKCYWISLLPAIFMTYIVFCFLFISPLLLGMENRLLCYILAAVGTTLVVIMGARRLRSN